MLLMLPDAPAQPAQFQSGFTPSPAFTRDVLIRARELVQRGWCRGWFREPRPFWKFWQQDRYCAVGAVIAAVGAASTIDDRVDAALKRLATAMGIPAHDFERYAVTVPIYCWNDKVGRTQGQVLAAFDRAIAMG